MQITISGDPLFKKLRLALTVSAFAMSAMAGSNIVRSAKPISGQYVVIFDNSKVADGAVAATNLIADRKVKQQLTYEGALRGFVFTGSEADADAFAKDPRVRFVQEDGLSTGATVLQNPATSWALDRIDQQVAVNRDGGGNWIPGTYTASYTGLGTVIYVVDSGINPIPSEFGTRIREAHNWAPGPDGVTISPTYTTDCADHGTRMASAAAGTSFGVAKDAKLVNVRVLNCSNSAPTSQITAGINWVTNDHLTNHPTEPAVMNISIITNVGIDVAMDTAVMNAVTSGITVTTCAGNFAEDACTHSPGHLGNPSQLPTPVITASATEVTDSFATLYANVGVCVDILSPGSHPQAMAANGAPSTDESGTSFSAPYVAGVAAIHMERYGIANSPNTIWGLIKDNATMNTITNVPAGTVNRFLWNGILRRHTCC